MIQCLNIDTSADKLIIASIQYLNILASHGTKSLIDKPTRVTPTSATILDHALTNVSVSSVLPGIIHYDITDHYSIFLKLHCSKKTKRIKTIINITEHYTVLILSYYVMTCILNYKIS